MSLKIFHLVFIVASFGLSLFVVLWGFREWHLTHSGGALALSIVFLLFGAALVRYGMYAVRKLKELS